MLINILYNLPAARSDFASSTQWTRILGSLFRQENLDPEVQAGSACRERWFLLLRMAFLVTIDAVGARMVIEQGRVGELGDCCVGAVYRLLDEHPLRNLLLQETTELIRILYNCSRFVPEDQQKRYIRSIYTSMTFLSFILDLSSQS